MEYLTRLSGLVAIPTKAVSIIASPRRKKGTLLHPVGSVDVFHSDWEAVRSDLESPDERALFYGIQRTDIALRLQRLVDALVFESNRSDEGDTGPCMEYLLQYDILSQLVDLSDQDKPLGVKGEVIRTLTNLIILLDEKFLSRQTVHKPISQLIQNCLDSDQTRFDHEQDTVHFAFADKGEDGLPLDYHEDLVDLMCNIASRIRNTPDLLHIFFSDEVIFDNADSIDSSVVLQKDGSVIVQDDSSCGTPRIDIRPLSPTESIDSTATLQPPKSADLARERTADEQYSVQRRLRFPLFSYLLRFIHREGRIGELARAGLLFLISLEGGGLSHGSHKKENRLIDKGNKRVSFYTADIRRSLATFVAHSDFADVLGAGLGAAYGLLPSRIAMAPRYDPTTTTQQPGAADSSQSSFITLASSSQNKQDGSESTQTLSSATKSDDPELQTQLRLMVDLIEFSQDVLDSLWIASKQFGGGEKQDRATAVVDPMFSRLAEKVALAVRDTFIRNVVYPSLMESIDLDGSATAVMCYLEVMMIVLRNGHLLTDAVLHFLLSNKRDAAEGNPTFGQDWTHDSRKSEFNLTIKADEADRYDLKDLILDNLAPHVHTQAKVAALKLARTLIAYHGQDASSSLLEPRLSLSKHRKQQRKSTVEGNESLTDLDTSLPRLTTVTEHKVSLHLREVDLYLSLVSNFGNAAALETMHTGFSQYLTDAEQAIRHDSTFYLTMDPSYSTYFGNPESGIQMQLNKTDPFFQQLCESLARLFRQPPEQNLAVSGVISALAISPSRCLEGWLTYPRQNESNRDETPAILDVLRSLSQQVQAYRDCAPDFDRYLSERRRGLLLAEDIIDALVLNESGEDATIEVGEKERKMRGEETSSEGSATKAQPLSACLSLPRMPASSGRIKTPERVRQAEREFGVVEDRRKDLDHAVKVFDEPTLPASGQTEENRHGQEPKSSTLARLFGGRSTRTIPASATSSLPSPVEAKKLAASTLSPFAVHYRQTAAIIVRARTASGAEAWRPEPTVAISTLAEDQVTLSSVLDNTILLEELIKELVAIIQVRRSWGIDPICFS